jgi:hypothetical protein
MKYLKKFEATDSKDWFHKYDISFVLLDIAKDNLAYILDDDNMKLQFIYDKNGSTTTSYNWYVFHLSNKKEFRLGDIEDHLIPFILRLKRYDWLILPDVIQTWYGAQNNPIDLEDLLDGKESNRILNTVVFSVKQTRDIYKEDY